MQGKISPAVAAVVLDLAHAGALGEVSDVPFTWLGASPEPLVPAVEKTSAEERAPAVSAQEAPKKVVRAVSPPPEKPAAAMEVEVWQHGEPGGVVLVVGGDSPPEGDAALLVERMLEAVGYGDLPKGWVGMKHMVHGSFLSRNKATLVGEAVRALDAARVLILGGAVLQAWSGKNTGVEAWRPDAEVLPGMEGKTVPVGVTYTPEMLLDKPLFKRLAWQHLQAWEAMERGS